MPDRSLKPGLILGIVQPPAHARRMGQREENASFALVPLADSVHQGQRTKNGVDRHLAHRKNRYRVHKAKCMVEETADTAPALAEKGACPHRWAPVPGKQWVSELM